MIEIVPYDLVVPFVAHVSRLHRPVILSLRTPTSTLKPSLQKLPVLSCPQTLYFVVILLRLEYPEQSDFLTRVDFHIKSP